MAYSNADLANIQSLIAGGASKVVIDGREVTYWPLDQLRQLKAEIEAELGIAPPAGTRGRAWRPSVSNGL